MTANQPRQDREQPPGQVADPTDEDYNQRQRLKEIWEERQSVREWRRETAHMIGQSLSQSEAERHFHEELKQYIGTIHTLLIDVYDEQGGIEMWKEQPLGTQMIRPPERIAEYVDTMTAEYRGLKSILETPARRTVRFEGTATHYRKRDETVVGTKTVTVDWNILDTAWLHANSFLSRVGFEADPEDDHTDIIREVRKETEDADPNQPVFEYDTVEEPEEPDL